MFKIDADTGLLQDASQVPSPNCDDRPPDCEPDLIIVHCISLPPGEFGGRGIEQLFTNSLNPDEHPYFREIAELRVSSHLLIRRNGEIVQFVPLNRRAWHAGESCFDGRDRCNDFSVGIELEGADDRPFTARQYRRLSEAVAAMRATIPSLAGAPVVGHSDVSPGRKTDPGPHFDWHLFKRLLAEFE
ncbi:MAG: 1,6-anhydro-N-acetylmuramyl-L-alanine amidase AmpD [Pseudomonadales bacterium]|nr:1,6-anhydro-N-acetylmuramyl-L-alanine amidase AmpD [Pseudomonadales bacterium]